MSRGMPSPCQCGWPDPRRPPRRRRTGCSSPSRAARRGRTAESTDARSPNRVGARPNIPLHRTRQVTHGEDRTRGPRVGELRRSALGGCSMRYRLDALFYTFLVIFAATAIVTLLGVIKVLPIEQENLRWLLGAFLIELAGAVIALFRGAPFFAGKEDVVTAMAHSVRVIDELKPEIEAVVAGKTQAEVNRHYGIVVRKEGNDLVAYQRMQVISGEQLKNLPPDRQEVVQTYEASMERFRDKWKKLYAKRSKATSEQERGEIDKQLAELTREMGKELHGVLDFLAGQGMMLEDHYR